MTSAPVNYSIFGRLLWFPLFSAPFTYTAPRIMLPAAACGLLAGFVGGKDTGVSVGLIVWITACWIVSFTYGRVPHRSTGAADPVPVHLLSPFGHRIEQWTIGVDVDLDQYARHRDRATGELFVLTVYEDGKERMHLLDRPHWLEAKRQMDGQSVD